MKLKNNRSKAIDCVYTNQNQCLSRFYTIGDSRFCVAVLDFRGNEQHRVALLATMFWAIAMLVSPIKSYF